MLHARSERPTKSEVPVLVLGGLGRAHDVGGARAGEEVVVLVGVRGQRGEDRRGDVGHLLGEQGLVAEVVQRLVRVVVQELLDLFGPPDRVAERLGVDRLVLMESRLY